MPIAIACIGRAGGAGVHGVDEAVGDAREARGVALFHAQLHVVQAQEGWGREAHNVHGQCVESRRQEVVEEGPRQGLLVDVPGAQQLLGGAADAVEQQVHVREGEVAPVARLQDIGRILDVQLAGQRVVARALREIW